MSQQLTEERLGEVEKSQAKLTADFRVMSHDVAGVKLDVGELKAQGSEVLRTLRSIENRAAAQPQPFTGKMILVTLGSIAGASISLFLIIWAVIQTSPAVSELDRRLTKVDDYETGKVVILSDRIRRLEEAAGVPPPSRKRPPPQAEKSSSPGFSFPF